jgi:hypothetical protein
MGTDHQPVRTDISVREIDDLGIDPTGVKSILPRLEVTVVKTYSLLYTHMNEHKWWEISVEGAMCKVHPFTVENQIEELRPLEFRSPKACIFVKSRGKNTIGEF